MPTPSLQRLGKNIRIIEMQEIILFSLLGTLSKSTRFDVDTETADTLVSVCDLMRCRGFDSGVDFDVECIAQKIKTLLLFCEAAVPDLPVYLAPVFPQSLYSKNATFTGL
jgi:hypothetical protein